MGKLVLLQHQKPPASSLAALEKWRRNLAEAESLVEEIRAEVRRREQAIFDLVAKLRSVCRAHSEPARK